MSAANPPKGASPDGFESELEQLLLELLPVKVLMVSDADGKAWQKDGNRLKRQIAHSKILASHANSLKGAYARGYGNGYTTGRRRQNKPTKNICPACKEIQATLSAESEAHDGYTYVRVKKS